MKKKPIFVCNDLKCSVYDIDYKNITNNKEIQFLKWTEIIELNVTLLKYNCEYYIQLSPLLTKNDSEFITCDNFIIVSLLNIIDSLIINFSKFFNQSDEYNLDKYINFCIKYHNDIFKCENDFNKKQIMKNLKAARKYYDKTFNHLRDKYYAHSGTLDKEDINSKLEDIHPIILYYHLTVIEKEVSGIWEKYCGKQLSYELKNENLLINKLIKN